jgi:hypothetical protein
MSLFFYEAQNSEARCLTDNSCYFVFQLIEKAEAREKERLKEEARKV